MARELAAQHLLLPHHTPHDLTSISSPNVPRKLVKVFFLVLLWQQPVTIFTSGTVLFRIDDMKEATTKNLEKLEEEKESAVAQMAELKKILYGKFKDSINLEED
ncbi:hypothetical protein RND71_040969 [Anisodus tanguticus]|uniref:Prefoldin subunit 4 n=1 Tax=Anisodus tanguticus TaxID=243964 RepID=A0AAE1QWG2_9SOLA|nr:hypothetical protein RND71_040969 [Anisodus tanguticus]